MWNKDKSIVLSQVLIKICYAAVVVCCIFAPKVFEYYDSIEVHFSGSGSVFIPMTATFYCCVPPALTALVCLDILLKNIKNDQAFINKNVILLRILSYCCFAVSAILVYFSVLRPIMFIVVFAAAFFGIILRVVKNCFQQAVVLREENDFTI